MMALRRVNGEKVGHTKMFLMRVAWKERLHLTFAKL